MICPWLKSILIPGDQPPQDRQAESQAELTEDAQQSRREQGGEQEAGTNRTECRQTRNERHARKAIGFDPKGPRNRREGREREAENKSKRILNDP